MTFVLSTLAGKRLHHVPPRLPVAGGLGLIAAGAIWQAIAGTDPWSIAPGLALTGVGIGLIGPTLGSAVAAATPPSKAGMGSGAMTTFRQLGQTVGVAALSVIFGVPTTSTQYAAAFHSSQAATAAAALLAGIATITIRPKIVRRKP